MKSAIGHFNQTAIFNGNVGLSAHNRDYKIDFRQLKNVQVGDIVEYKTNLGTRKYKVTVKKDILETDFSYLENTNDNRITMLKNVQVGDIVEYKTNLGTRKYKVTVKKDILETDFSYLENTNDNRITMITCIANEPTKRLVVQAVQI